jgi:hypothetical protein
MHFKCISGWLGSVEKCVINKISEMTGEIWLIGDRLISENDTPLPTNAQLLRKLYFYGDIEKFSFASACAKIAETIYFELQRIGLHPLAKNSINAKVTR